MHHFNAAILSNGWHQLLKGYPYRMTDLSWMWECVNKLRTINFPFRFRLQTKLHRYMDFKIICHR